jgi:hypothetical protein
MLWHTRYPATLDARLARPVPYSSKQVRDGGRTSGMEKENSMNYDRLDDLLMAGALS